MVRRKSSGAEIDKAKSELSDEESILLASEGLAAMLDASDDVQALEWREQQKFRAEELRCGVFCFCDALLCECVHVVDVGMYECGPACCACCGAAASP